MARTPDIGAGHWAAYMATGARGILLSATSTELRDALRLARDDVIQLKREVAMMLDARAEAEPDLTTPEGRFLKIVDDLELIQGSDAAPTVVQIEAEGPFLLVERNTSGNMPPFVLSLFNAPDNAAFYRATADDAGDWMVDRLVDLRTGEEYDADEATVVTWISR